MGPSVEMLDMEYSEFLGSYRKVPSCLFRSFEREEHMRQFMAGHIRLGHYRYYFHRSPENWTWEDLIANPALLKKSSRTNKYEGNIRQLQIRQTDGSIKRLDVFSQGSPHYSLCFSTEVNRDYGDYVIRLNDPIEFHQRIKRFLNTDSGHYAGSMVYCNGLVVEMTHDPRLICLYTDATANASKNEFRFSYDILLENGFLVLSDGSRREPSGALRYENDSAVEELTLPHFCWFQDIRIDDLFTVVSS